MSDIAALKAETEALKTKVTVLENGFLALKNSTTTHFSAEDQATLDAVVADIHNVNTGLDSAVA